MEEKNVRSYNRILIKAVKKQDYEAVNNLLRNGSDVNEIDCDGNSSLHHAVSLKNFKIIELLLEHNAKVDMENDYGERAYDLAFNLYDYNIVKILLQYKAEVRIHHIGKLEGFSENFKQLLYSKVNIEHSDCDGYTALHHAVKSNDLKGIRTLISRGAHVNRFTGREVYTCLHLVKSVECMKMLLQEGAIFTFQYFHHVTPLYAFALKTSRGLVHLVEKKERQRMIEVFTRNEADCVEVIQCCQTALDYRTAPVNFSGGVEEVLKFMALKEHERHYINISSLKLNNENNVLGSFYRHCLEEVELLKKNKLSDYLTYYDFVAKNVDELSKYVNNKSIKKAFKKKSMLTNTFPIYSEILWRHFKEATEKRRLYKTACSSLSCAIPYISAAHLATYTILNFLEIEDMKNLVEAFPLVKL